MNSVGHDQRLIVNLGHKCISIAAILFLIGNKFFQTSFKGHNMEESKLLYLYNY